MNDQATPAITEVKTFRAQSMSEALRIVKAELGPDAVILHTRQIPGRRRLPWQNSPDEFEITAGLGVDENRPVKTHQPKPRPQTPPPNFKQIAAQLAKSNDPGVRVELSQRSQPSPAAQSIPQPAEPNVAELARQIDSIQKLLAQLGLKAQEAPAAAVSTELPEPLVELKKQLLDREIPEPIALELLSELKRECSEGELENSARTNAILAARIGEQITVGGPIRIEPGKRKVVALVGATGVGKTTTIAKLAANYRLRDHVKMGLVTVDTYRIAAVEQLRTYAEIIDLPMKVVTNPMEMRRALDELLGLDLILIDTAGRSPRDDLQIQELKRLLAEASVDEVHLVLSMTSNLRNLIASVEKFAFANATSLILTKLDEAAALGSLLELTREVSLPISYLTTGQDVPSDIEPANTDRIARLILGRDSI